MADWEEIKDYLKDDEGLFVSIKRAFEDLYANDDYLIGCYPLDTDIMNGNHHVGERSIVFRYAYYLQNELLKYKRYADFNLDCEYNRNLYEPKSYVTNCGKKKLILPDLVIHQRGEHDSNLLVIEFKTHWNKEKNAIDEDKKKVIQLKKPPYNYSYGLVVIVERTIDELQIIQITGKEVLD